MSAAGRMTGERALRVLPLENRDPAHASRSLEVGVAVALARRERNGLRVLGWTYDLLALTLDQVTSTISVDDVKHRRARSESRVRREAVRGLATPRAPHP